MHALGLPDGLGAFAPKPATGGVSMDNLLEDVLLAITVTMVAIMLSGVYSG